MTFTIHAADLLNKLVSLYRVIIPNPVVPILDNFLLELKGNQLTVTASDLQTFVVTQLKVEQGAEDSRIAVPARILMETLKSLPEQPLKFVIDTKRYHLTIYSQTGIYKLACESAADYPKLPQLKSSSSPLHLPVKFLKEALENVLFSVSKNDLYAALTGVHLVLTPEQMQFIATDGHRLARYIRTNLKGEESHTITLPAKPLDHLTKEMSRSKATDAICYIQEEVIFFQLGDLQLITRLIVEDFPNYENVIPKNNPYLLEIDKSGLIDVLRRMAIYTNKSTQQVRLKPTTDKLYVYAEDLDFSNQAEESLPCNYKGQPFEIGFNVRSLIEILQKITTKEVKFSLDAARTGVTIEPDKQEPEQNLLLLIMPVLLKDQAETT